MKKLIESVLAFAIFIALVVGMLVYQVGGIQRAGELYSQLKPRQTSSAPQGMYWYGRWCPLPGSAQ